jgi:hypothetical protein
MIQPHRAEEEKMGIISKQYPLALCVLGGIVLILSTGLVYSAEQEQTFPPDVQEFISDRVSCDHFRGEPRDFDESYKRKGGKQAEIEEADRAAFLEKMTEKTCFQMDKRLMTLVKKYRADKIVSDMLDQYEYLDIGTDYVWINESFPNAKLIQQKLIAKGFSWGYVRLSSKQKDGDEYPVLTVQIGPEVDVNTAQRALEIILKFASKDVGVVVLPKTSHSYYASRILVGSQPIGNYQIYVGDSIQNLLSPDLTQADFGKFAKLMEPDPTAIGCSKELTACSNKEGVCLMMNIDDSKCDSVCQAELFRKLYSVGVQPIASTAPILHSACIGYRKDKGGTEKGAKCLADLLGYKPVIEATAAYDPEGCFTYDRAYYVWAH